MEPVTLDEKPAAKLCCNLTVSLWVWPQNLGTGTYAVIEKNRGGEFALIVQTNRGLTFAQGMAAVQRATYVVHFDLARQYGAGSLTRALGGVSARTLLIAFSSDWLYPPSASREIEDALRELGRPVELHVIDAPYGHDCFLLEEGRQTPIIRRFLEGPP